MVVEALETVTNKLTETKNLQIWHDSKVKQIDLAQKDLQPTTIVLDNEKTIQTSLIIGADGANSKLRHSMTHLIDYTSKDYQQMGLVGTITFEDSETRDDIAFQKFMPHGPIALLPLCKGKASLVWTLPTAKAKEFKKLDPEKLAKELNNQLNMVYPRSQVVDGLNGVFGLFLRSVRQKIKKKSKPKNSSNEMNQFHGNIFFFREIDLFDFYQ